MDIDNLIDKRFICTHIFKVDNLKYQFLITAKFEVIFSLISGVLPDGRHFPEYDPFEKWDDDPPGITSTIRYTKNPTKVFRCVIKELQRFLSRVRPRYFFLQAVENNRVKLYKRLSDQISKKTKYQVTSDEDRYFVFQLR